MATKIPTVESATKLGWSTNITVFMPSSPYIACIIGIPTKEVFPKPAHIIKAPITEYFQPKNFPRITKKTMARKIPIHETKTGKSTELLSSILEI